MFKFWGKNKNKRSVEPDFSFIKEWDALQYSYIICISDELKRFAGDRHFPLIFSCAKSIETYSNLVRNGECKIIICDEAIVIPPKSLFIDEYILFLCNPDYLLTNNQLFSQLSKYFNNEWCLKYQYLPTCFIYDEKKYTEYEKVAGKETADKIFFKVDKIRFNSLQIGTTFIYGGKVYEKVPLVNEGCCSPSFNCININDGNDLIYLNNSALVEKIL